MTRTHVRTAALAASVLAAAGCTLYDGRSLDVTVVGATTVTDTLRVRIDASAGLPRAELSIDGHGIGSWPTGQDLDLDVSTLEEDAHVLEARVDGGHPPAPATTSFLVDRGPPTVVSVTPKPGATPPGHIRIEVQLSKRLDPTNPGSATLVEADGGHLPCTLALAGDGRTVVLTTDFPLEWYSPVGLSLTVRDHMAHVARFELGPWRVAEITASVGPVASGHTNGTVTLEPHASGYEASGAPARARLYANDLLLAELGSPPWAAITWDTRTVPEGYYVFRFEVPGYLVHAGAGLAVHVDRTPPRLTCSVRGGEYAYGDCLTVGSTDAMPAPAFLVDGARFPADLSWVYESSNNYLCPSQASVWPTPPFTLSLDTSTAADAAGNVAVLDGCTFAVPAWRTPFGASPAGGPGGTFRATELSAPTWWSGVLAWIPPAGAPNAGRVLAANAQYDLWGNFTGWDAPDVLPSAEAADLVSGGSAFVWDEGLAGPGLVVGAGPADPSNPWVRSPADPFNADPAHDARRPAGAYYGGVTASGALVAWSEADGVGGRTIQAKLETRDSWTDVWTFVAGDVRSAGLVADEPAVSFVPSGTYDVDRRTLLAFVESTPLIPQVRAAAADLSVSAAWTPVPGSLNVDAATAAGEPTVLAGTTTSVVAWAEGGRVFARTSADPFGGAAFGPAAMLNVNPVARARTPRAAPNAGGPVVVFVEEGAAGDEIWARRWDGAAWVLLPGPVNAGAVAGRVTAIAVDDGPTVAWADATGAIRVRVGNF